jgi:hypothetical protein
VITTFCPTPILFGGRQILNGKSEHFMPCRFVQLPTFRNNTLMKAADYSEMLVPIYQTIRRHIPWYRNLKYNSRSHMVTLWYTLKTQRGSTGTVSVILNFHVRWGVINTTLRPLSPSAKSPGTSRKEGWVGSGAGLDGYRHTARTGPRTPNRQASNKSLCRLRYTDCYHFTY